MPRPKKPRTILAEPKAVFYKPQGVPLRELKGVILPLEGFEALRLSDAEGLSQEDGAALMEVSRPTFCRILAEARQLVAQALANGWAIRIEGGSYALAQEQAPPHGPGRGRRRGRGGGRKGGREPF